MGPLLESFGSIAQFFKVLVKWWSERDKNGSLAGL